MPVMGAALRHTAAMKIQSSTVIGSPFLCQISVKLSSLSDSKAAAAGNIPLREIGFAAE